MCHHNVPHMSIQLERSCKEQLIHGSLAIEDLQISVVCIIIPKETEAVTDAVKPLWSKVSEYMEM